MIGSVVYGNDGEPLGWANKDLGLIYEGFLVQLDMAWLLFNLLEWQRQSERLGDSFRDDIIEQRHKAANRIRETPRLTAALQDAEWWEGAWAEALNIAAAETDLLPGAFPASCPWSFEQIMDVDFWPSPVGDA